MVRSTADLADEQGDGVRSCHTQLRANLEPHPNDSVGP